MQAAALESVEYVQASAAQAYLECDPAERQPGDVYTERYTARTPPLRLPSGRCERADWQLLTAPRSIPGQRMAKEKADAALEGFGALEVTLGTAGSSPVRCSAPTALIAPAPAAQGAEAPRRTRCTPRGRS